MQDRQKTVVAFVAGLLVGGLLVWVFSSTGSKAPVSDQASNNSNDVAVNDTSANGSNDTTTTANTSEKIILSAGSFTVADQAAGMSVALGKISFPSANGWVVVRDYENGVGGNILGAARYEAGVGLSPESVELLRKTETGKSYQVVFFNENGDKIFDKATDAEIDGASAVFKAK